MKIFNHQLENKSIKLHVAIPFCVAQYKKMDLRAEILEGSALLGIEYSFFFRLFFIHFQEEMKKTHVGFMGTNCCMVRRMRSNVVH